MIFSSTHKTKEHRRFPSFYRAQLVLNIRTGHRSRSPNVLTGHRWSPTFSQGTDGPQHSQKGTDGLQHSVKGTDGPSRSQRAQMVPNKVKLANCNCYKYSFFVRIIREWNDLPSNVVEIGNLKRFKIALKSYMRIS